ncbi:MAG: hypothetical protein ACREUG_01170 [Steroidobacteraceae bacterium]
MSLRAAIDAMCKSCMYDPIGGVGTWRAQVERCTAYSCPLHRVRPKVRQRIEVRPEVQDEAKLAPKRTIAVGPKALNGSGAGSSLAEHAA